MTGAEISATLIRPVLTDELKRTLIAMHKADTRYYAYLVWWVEDEERYEIKPCKWKGKAYEYRGDMVQYDGYDMDQFLIVDVVDLNQL